MLHEVVPAADAIAVLVNPDNPNGALDANEALVEPIHTMFETHEIGAQPNQLILYRRHASHKIMKAAQDRVELCIDLPKHSQRQIFGFVNH